MASSWLTWALLSAVLAAATAVLVKAGVRGVDPDVAQFIRTVVVLAAVGGMLAATGRGRGIFHLSGATWTYLVLAGLATAGSWACYFRALAAGDASRVAAVDKLSVPLVAVLAALTFGERLGAAGWAGVALAAAGAALVSWGR